METLRKVNVEFAPLPQNCRMKSILLCQMKRRRCLLKRWCLLASYLAVEDHQHYNHPNDLCFHITNVLSVLRFWSTTIDFVLSCFHFNEVPSRKIYPSQR